jgi:cell shape-determining protein MreD
MEGGDLRYMKNRILVPIAVIFAFLQGTVLPPVFLEGFFVILIANMYSDDKILIRRRVLISAFCLSLVFDLVQGSRLGVTALIFGGFLVFLAFSKRYFSAVRSTFLAALCFLIPVVRGKILFGELFLFEGFLVFILSYLFFKFLWQPYHTAGIRLRG